MIKTMNETPVSSNYYINTIMKNKTLKVLMGELEEVEQKASKIRTNINNILKLKND